MTVISRSQRISQKEHAANAATWDASVYVVACALSANKVQIPHHGICWLPVGHCPGLGRIRAGEVGAIYIPGWLVRLKKIEPSRWCRLKKEL